MLRKLLSRYRFLLTGMTVVAGVLLGIVLVGGLAMAFAPSPAVASDNQQEVPAVVDEALANQTCDISNIAVISTRIHVQCRVGAGAIVFFAMSTANANVNRVLSLMLTAETADKRLVIAYDPLASGAAFGCLNANCRPISYIYVLDN